MDSIYEMAMKQHRLSITLELVLGSLAVFYFCWDASY